jgi:hypothetical protein
MGGKDQATIVSYEIISVLYQTFMRLLACEGSVILAQ